MSEPENVSGYRETSEVLNLNRQKGFGFLRRPCGDAIFFHRNDVVQGLEDRWDFLEVGSPVWHGVKLDGSTGRWRAADVELYSYQELESFKHENDPAAVAVAVAVPEPEPAPEPAVAALEFSVIAPEPTVVTPQSEWLRPENKNKSLFELIQERRKA